MVTAVVLIAASGAFLITYALAFLRAGITREDSDRSIRGEPATLSSAVTRRVVGLYVRMPQPAPYEQDRSQW